MNEKEIQVKKFFEEHKRIYDETWDSENHTLHVGIFQDDDTLQRAFKNSTQYLEARINQYSRLDKNSRILDVCCGTGRTLLYLTEKYGCTGTGIDISQEQVKDAQEHDNGRCEFIADTIENIASQTSQKYTHVISQDGIFLVHNKRKCYEQIYQLLEDKGLLVVSDFLAEKPTQEIDKERLKGLYETVKWEKGLSFEEYKKLLSEIGFENILAEEKNVDMKRTYQKLIAQIAPFIQNKDNQYSKLAQRYTDIVDGIDNKEIGWVWFVYQKRGVTSE